MQTFNKNMVVKETNGLTVNFESYIQQNYIIAGELNKNVLSSFLQFHNDLVMIQSDTNKPVTLNLFLNSIGGELYVYSTLKSILENSNLSINLIANGEISSAAFFLFYITDNVNKYVELGTSSTVHTITTYFSDREMRKLDIVATFKEDLDKHNNIFVKLFNKYDILNKSELKRFIQGEDIYIGYAKLVKLMEKCPFGSFINGYSESEDFSLDIFNEELDIEQFKEEQQVKEVKKTNSKKN